MRKILSKPLILVIGVALIACAAYVYAQTSAIYFDPGGAKQHIGNGGTLVVDTGGTLDLTNATVTGSVTITGVTATNTEINKLHSLTTTAADFTALHGAATTATLAITTGATNTATITITVKDSAGGAIAYPGVVNIWLSAAATGIGLGSAPSTGITAGASGTLLGANSNKLFYTGLTSASGVFVASLLDTAKATSYVCVSVDHGMGPICSAQLVTGNFG